MNATLFIAAIKMGIILMFNDLCKQFHYRPNMIGQTGSHCRGAFNAGLAIVPFDFQRLVWTAEIEKGHGQGDREDEILHRLGKAWGQPREPLVEMAQAQIEPLGVRCGNGLPIWRSTNAARINRDAFAWAVPDAFWPMRVRVTKW
jgi:hypothetical protein